MNAREAIKQTFARLVNENNYDKIRIAQITEEADIARATFYLHFRTKDELMISYIDEMFQRFYDSVESELDSPSDFGKEVAVKMFETFQEEPAFSQLLKQHSARSILLNRFHNYLSRMYGRMLRSSGSGTLPTEQLEYAIQYNASGSLSLLAGWISNDFRPDCDTMGDLYFKMVKKGMWETLGIPHADTA